MDKEIILKYKEVSGKSLIDSFIKYKTTDIWKYTLLIDMYTYKRKIEELVLFGNPTINTK